MDKRLRIVVLAGLAVIIGWIAATPAETQPAPDPCVSTDGRRSDNEVWTTNSWGFFNRRDYQGAVANAGACIDNWSSAATQIQARMGSNCPIEGAATAEQQTAIHRNGVLNDVATNYWILGRSHQALGNRAEARAAYASCAALPCARTWDPRGWFWNPATDCANRARQLN